MTDLEKAKRQLLGDGPNTPKKPSPKRKPSKRPASARKKAQPKPEVAVETVPVAEQNVIFAPNEGPQTEFLAAGEREVLYGGAAGGGKSYASWSIRFAI